MLASTALSYLAGATLRSLCLLVLALAAIGILRVRTAAARHALWTSVVAGMLLLLAFSALAPPIAWRVLGGRSVAPVDIAVTVSQATQERVSAAAAPATPVRHRPSWSQVAVALYALVALLQLIRMSFGYLFARRLVRASVLTELGPEPIHQSSWISVPLTVGCIHPKIVLPADWRTWERPKLAAVLAHERTHVRRCDWGIALLAGINRCIFWFHPLAWWLERQLATLAEQACDDSALLQMESREPYAQALLDMAAAVKTAQGRLVWEAMAMAKASEVSMRIERILDETRQIPREVSRRRWTALAACSLPLIYMASVVQLAPAQVQEPVKVQRTASDGISNLTTADAARMEQALVTNPDDLETRSKLIAYYFLNDIREPRLSHILWMIGNHPESELAAFNSSGISPQVNSLNSGGDYQRAASLWQQQVAIHPKDPKVLANAAQFYAQRGGDWYEAERLLKQSGDIAKLASFYAKALNVSTDSLGALHFPALDDNNAFANKAIAELEASTNADLLFETGNSLRSVPRNADTQTLRLLQPRADLGNRLLVKAEQLGGSRYQVAPTAWARGGSPTSTQSTLPKPVDLPQAPQVLNKIAPEYNPTARQARIQSDIHLGVTIGTDGRVSNILVLTGHPLLIQNAVDAVKQWLFAPAQQNGLPVVARFSLVVPFRLDGGDGPLPALPPPPPPPPSGKSASVSPRADGQDAKPPMPQRIRVGANVQMASLMHQVEATYPEQALTAGPNGGPLEGSVKLSVVIGNDGTVQSVTPLEGHPLLAAAAQAAVQQWTYKPTRLNGEPVQVATTVDINFTAK
jgi:TonB family protein